MHTPPALPPALAQLRQLLHTELSVAPLQALGPDTPLFETLLDSTSILSLVSHLEQQFHIQIDDQELVPANFSTLRRLGEFIARKTDSGATPMAANG